MPFQKLLRRCASPRLDKDAESSLLRDHRQEKIYIPRQVFHLRNHCLDRDAESSLRCDRHQEKINMSQHLFHSESTNIPKLKCRKLAIAEGHPAFYCNFNIK
jgi:hypothetical protein